MRLHAKIVSVINTKCNKHSQWKAGIIELLCLAKWSETNTKKQPTACSYKKSAITT